MVMGTEHMHWKELLKSGHKLETCRNNLKIIGISSVQKFYNLP